SPDGSMLVFGVIDTVGVQSLWVRPLDALEAHKLAVTETSLFPFWSPDSRFIGFFGGGKLKKIPAAGGPAEILCDAPDGRGGTWSQKGDIVFAPVTAGPLMRVSANGG